MKSPVLLDAYGRPIERKALTRVLEGATLGGVRSPISGYPGDGLNPVRLANILREADVGDPIRYLELAETIEERDLHYQGVLGTRRRAVSQIEISVEAASDAPEHEKHAQLIREWLKRDELQEEMFNILDAVGKGYMRNEDGSLTRINEEGQPIDDEGNVIEAAHADALAEIAAPDPAPPKPTRAARTPATADAPLTEKEV